MVITYTLPENPPVLEGIGIGDVFDINKGVSNTYMRNLTMKNSMGDKMGRDMVLNDNCGIGVNADSKGVVIKIDTLADGSERSTKIINR